MTKKLNPEYFVNSKFSGFVLFLTALILLKLCLSDVFRELISNHFLRNAEYYRNNKEIAERYIFI